MVPTKSLRELELEIATKIGILKASNDPFWTEALRFTLQRFNDRLRAIAHNCIEEKKRKERKVK